MSIPSDRRDGSAAGKLMVARAEEGASMPVSSDLAELLRRYELASSLRAMADELLRYSSTSG
jgi:hypothetical protein